ncbi:MAG: hydantoinase B/oxoprolinase family protein [Candidatus Hodarchaeota archaeon]
MGEIDPVTLEIIKNLLLSVAQEMGVTLQRSAYSSNIKTRLDFACAIFDSDIRNVAQALHIPALLGGLVSIVPAAIKEYGIKNIEQGDVLIVNDPYRGGTHLPDVTLISPAFYDSKIAGFVANMAHHQDIGGRAPGGVPGDTTDIYQEGLIIPTTKLVEGGKINEEILKLLLANVRAPLERAGDYRAQIAANRTGIKRITEVIEQHGLKAFEIYEEELLNYTERRMRSALKEIPDGEYYAEDYLDDDGIGDDPVRIAAKIILEEGRTFIDLSDSDKQTQGPMNCTWAPTLSAISYVFKCLVDPDIPINEGMYRPLRLHAPGGLVLNARPPAAIAGCWEVAMRVTDVLMRALAKAVPEKVCAAGKGIICNVCFGGIDPRDGRVYAFYETIGGGYGARPSKDGMEGVQYHLTNTQNAPVEELETSYPVIIERYELIPDSDGAGRFRGGLGIRRDYRFENHSAVFSIVSDRAKIAPWGLSGGLDGKKSRYILNPDTPNEIELSSKTFRKLRPGDLISVQTPGGGGYGDPKKRQRIKTLEDIKNGKISPEKAKQKYRLSLDQLRMFEDV